MTVRDDMLAALKTAVIPPSVVTTDNFASVDVDTGGGSVVGSIADPTSGIANTDTLVVKTAALAANKLASGSTIKITFYGTETASGTQGTPQFFIHIGTNGTTADPIIQTITLATSSTTSADFSGYVTMVVRTSGGSATSSSQSTTFSQAGRGLQSTTIQLVVGSQTNTFNTATANQVITFSFKSGSANCSCAFKHAIIELIN